LPSKEASKDQIHILALRNCADSPPTDFHVVGFVQTIFGQITATSPLLYVVALVSKTKKQLASVEEIIRDLS
jgi:hypothetical protein